MGHCHKNSHTQRDYGAVKIATRPKSTIGNRQPSVDNRKSNIGNLTIKGSGQK